MVDIVKSATFERWIASLRDAGAVTRITARLLRLAVGNPGDVKAVGGGVSELRIDYGPGYRVYFAKLGLVTIVLLCGGDKRTQAADIKRAINMAKDWKKG